MTEISRHEPERRLEHIASRLRQRIMIQQPDNTSDDAGGIVKSWADLSPAWAEIEPLSAGESFQAERMQSATIHRITIRFRDDVTTAMRILFEGRIFNIRAITNLLERDILLELLAEEGVAT
jgi:SPP1 family predicted phage head-tail adaptor